MNAQFNKKKKQKTKTHPCINSQGKKKRTPGGRAAGESNKNIIRRRNHGMRSNSKPELPIDILLLMQSAQKRASSPEIKRSGRNGAVGLALQA